VSTRASRMLRWTSSRRRTGPRSSPAGRVSTVDMLLPPAPSGDARARWEAAYDADPEGSHAQLADVDPAAASAVHPHDRRRVVRALELAEVGASLAPDADRLWSEEVRRPTLVVGLRVDPESLEERIRARTEAMFAAGVVEEVRRAVERDVSRTAEKALGLRELAGLPQETAFERILVKTRRYAAYQRKWMRRIPGIVMIEADRPANEVADEILEVARAR
jgi:tRNA dimethylallyltransferase